MMCQSPPSPAVDAYIASAPEISQPMLRDIRALIRAAAPTAAETISYGMPTYRSQRNLVHFAAHKTHLGFYPTPSVILKFAKELSSYQTSKGAIRFPYTRPLPGTLITKIVQFRVMEEDSKISQ